jgi:hypothetical protein
VYEREIVDSRLFLSRIGVWPKERQLHVSGWIDNFTTDDDREVAHALLDAVVYINDDHRRAALLSSVRSLSTRPEFGQGDEREPRWNDFLDQVIASIPLAHAGDGAASGYYFLRVARSIGFTRNLDSEHVVQEILRGSRARPVIFMDDISSTGNQFLRNWDRVYTTPAGRSSLVQLARNERLGRVYFTPIVATEFAKERIERETGVQVCPAYLIGEDYFATSMRSRLVPASLRDRLQELAQRYSPLTGQDDDGPFGYKDQGLALSFTDSAPNTTLPILRSSRAQPNWTPLITND